MCERMSGSGCNVRTQDPENFDEEVKSLVTAWWNLILYALSSSPGISFLDEVKNGNTIVSILTVQHLSYTSASITRKKPFISAGEEEMDVTLGRAHEGVIVSHVQALVIKLFRPGLDNTRLFISLTAGAGTRCIRLLSSSPIL